MPRKIIKYKIISENVERRYVLGTTHNPHRVNHSFETKRIKKGDKMKKELDNFIIESDIELTYFYEVVNYVVENSKRILDFFKLEKLPHKVKILVLSYEPFKDFIISKYGEILDYISGDSDSATNTIRILNIDDQIKYTTHKDADVERIKTTALHEIIHQCHHVYHTDYRQTTWFSEGLATNLSNQKYNIQDLNNCSKKKIELLYKNPDYLRESADRIFEKSKLWVNGKLD